MTTVIDAIPFHHFHFSRFIPPLVSLVGWHVGQLYQWCLDVIICRAWNLGSLSFLVTEWSAVWHELAAFGSNIQSKKKIRQIVCHSFICADGFSYIFSIGVYVSIRSSVVLNICKLAPVFIWNDKMDGRSEWLIDK